MDFADDELFSLSVSSDEPSLNIIADEIEMFALHSRRPYVRIRYRRFDAQLCRGRIGSMTFLNQLSQSIKGSENEWHQGPYTLGVKWISPKVSPQ